MTPSLHLTLNISHLSLIDHFTFNRFEQCQMLNAKSLIIDNCKLVIEPTVGGAL